MSVESLHRPSQDANSRKRQVLTLGAWAILEVIEEQKQVALQALMHAQRSGDALSHHVAILTACDSLEQSFKQQFLKEQHLGK